MTHYSGTVPKTGQALSNTDRVKVDVSETAFFERRQFRVYHEFEVAAGLSTWVRFVVPVGRNVIIHRRELTITTGDCRFALGTAGVAAGVWVPKAIFPVNAMTEQPAYAGVVTAEIGGTFSAVAERDVMVLGTPVGGQAVTVSAVESEVGLPAGTYSVEVRNVGSGTLKGLYKVVWEERIPAV